MVFWRVEVLQMTTKLFLRRKSILLNAGYVQDLKRYPEAKLIKKFTVTPQYK